MKEEENPNDKKNEKEEESKEEATIVVSTVDDVDEVVAADIVLEKDIVDDNIVLAVGIAKEDTTIIESIDNDDVLVGSTIDVDEVVAADIVPEEDIVEIAKEDTTIIVFTAILFFLNFFLNWWTSDPTKAALDHLDETVDVHADTERFQKICLNSITVWLLLHVTSNTSHVTSFIVIHHEKILLLLNLMSSGPTKAEVLDRPDETLDDHADIGWFLYICLNTITVWFFLQFTSFNWLKYIKRKYPTAPTTTTNTTGNLVAKPNTGGCGHIWMIMKKTMIMAMFISGIFLMPNNVNAIESQYDDNKVEFPHNFNPLDPEHVRPLDHEHVRYMFDFLPSTHQIPDSMPSPAVIGPLVIGSPPSTSSTFALMSPSTSTRSASSTLPSDTTTSFLPNSSFPDASSPHIFNANYTDLFDDNGNIYDDDYDIDGDDDDLDIAINNSLNDLDPNCFITGFASMPQTSSSPSGGPSGDDEDSGNDEDDDDLNMNIAINNSLNDLVSNYFNTKAASLPGTSGGPSVGPSGGTSSSPNLAPNGGSSGSPSASPSPGASPSGGPNASPSSCPSFSTSGGPSASPSGRPSADLSSSPSSSPCGGPSLSPSTSPSGVDEDFGNDEDDDDLNMNIAINRSLQDLDRNYFNTEAASMPTPVVLQTITNRQRRSITPSTPNSRITSYKQRSISDLFSTKTATTGSNKNSWAGSDRKRAGSSMDVKPTSKKPRNRSFGSTPISAQYIYGTYLY